jgi:hypothetical protein
LRSKEQRLLSSRETERSFSSDELGYKATRIANTGTDSMEEHLQDEVVQHSDPPTVSYYVNLRGSLFDPRRVEWPIGEVVATDMKAPGETCTSRRGKQFVAQEGSVTLRQPTPLLEMNIFTDADPVLQFLVRNHDRLRGAGVEKVVVMLGLYRDGLGGQMNGELSQEQVRNLCRAGAAIGFSFY